MSPSSDRDDNLEGWVLLLQVCELREELVWESIHADNVVVIRCNERKGEVEVRQRVHWNLIHALSWAALLGLTLFTSRFVAPGRGLLLLRLTMS